MDVNAGSYPRRFYGAAALATNAPLGLGVVSQTPWAPNGLQLLLDGPLGKNIRIEAPTNLRYWATGTNFSDSVVPFLFDAPASSNYGQRFYRAVTP